MTSFLTKVNNMIKENHGKAKAANVAKTWFNKGRSIGIKHAPTRFKPGKIYIFRYEDPKTPNLPWWDRNPIVLSLGWEKKNDIGINLNLLPHKPRMAILDKVYSVYEQEIKRAMNVKKGRDRTLREKPLNLNYDKIKPYLERYGFKFAVRQYIPNLKSNQALVSYDKWTYVAMLDLVDIAGADINEVYDEFYNYTK